MPERNGTGPRGQGPRTGRGLGFCQSVPTGEAEVFTPRVLGRRFGRGGPSRLRQRGRWNNPLLAEADQPGMPTGVESSPLRQLINMVSSLQEEVGRLHERIEDLQTNLTDPIASDSASATPPVSSPTEGK